MYKITRNTMETQICLSLDYPARGSKINVPCGFLSHMLELMAHRGRFCLNIDASGDTHVDAHHLTEDIGIVMGLAMKELLISAKDPNKSPIKRYGWCLLPMDGTLAQVALDLSGRGGLFWNCNFPTEKCGDFDLELVEEFFSGFCRESRATMHVSLLSVDNSHHGAEAIFKGVGLALDMALSPADVEHSTKGEWI